MITPESVRELRDKTQAGMMDCKRALEEAQGDMEQAVEILRKKGMALARKKETRLAKEGILGSYFDEKGRLACLVEVNCETDFVIKTDDFQKFVVATTKSVQQKAPKDLESLAKIIQEPLTQLIAKIGENIQVRRFVRWETNGAQEGLGFYLHAGSKIGVIVQISDPKKPVDINAAKEIAMHVAAMNPRYVRPEEVPLAVIEKEKEILRAAVDQKKPKEIREKIIDGKLNKFYSEECLEHQVFVKDPEGKKTVKDWLKGASPSARIERFVRLQVGG